jgi:hypothetical protein
VPTIYSLLNKHPPVDYSKEIEDEAGPELSGGKHGAPQRGSQEQPA